MGYNLLFTYTIRAKELIHFVSPHLLAAAQALFVTFLWSTSWVLIKIGLAEIPALTFAGLRYTLAFLCLLPFNFTPSNRSAWRCLTRRDWAFLVALGVLYYAVTQGSQFVGLSYLPAITVSLLLNFTSAMVALMGIFVLGERPTRWQWLGIALFLAGVVIYFYPVDIPAQQVVGLLVVIAGVAANAASSVMGRQVNREVRIPPLTVTTISMGVGAAIMLVSGVAAQGLPSLSLQNWGIIIWLAVVNTAFAFTLWNHTLRTLSALESSIINSTMMIQIALLAWLFLDEHITLKAAAGMIFAGVGALIVQLRR